jgi:hypothetical protein
MLSSEHPVHPVLSIVQTSDMGCRSVGMPLVGKESTKRTPAQYIYREAQTEVVAKVKAQRRK